MEIIKNEEFLRVQKEVQEDYMKMKSGKTEIIDFEEFEKTISELKL